MYPRSKSDRGIARFVAIHGTIEETGLSDVLQLLATGAKSGCLSVAAGDDLGEIFLESGRIAFAEVARRRDRFGELLVKSGRISQEQLERAAALQQDDPRPLPDILVDNGIVERRLMERLVRIQVEEAVYFLFSWKSGEFTFTSARRTPQQTFVMSLDAEGLLLEGSRRVDELDVIRRRIPSYDLVYRRGGSSLGLAAADLSEHQQRILPLLDGTRDVAGIIETSGLGEFNVAKALYGLITAGFAQLLERRSRMRHLEYREVLAYVMREAGFQDAERRKDAARHIADCPSCARRLRNIHVRRTEGGGANNRRAGRDRRQLDRRERQERRVAANAEWLGIHEDRRDASRRKADRRGGGGHRRSEDQPRRGGRLSLGGPRPVPAGGTPAASPAPPAPPSLSAAAAPPPEPAMPRPAPRNTEARRLPAVRAPAPDPAPAPAPAPREPAGDLVWITTPEESMEMVRQHRNTRARPPVPAPIVPDTPKAIVAAAPAQPIETVAAAPAPVPKPVAESADLPMPATVSIRHSRPATAPRRTTHARRRAHRARAIGIAAAITALGLGGGYGVMELGSNLANPRAETSVTLPRAPAPAVKPADPVAPVAAAPRDSTIAAQTIVRDTMATRAPRPAPIAAAPPATVPASAVTAPALAAPAPVTASVTTAPDSELAGGGWTAIDRTEAKAILDGMLAAIPGLRIESITTSSVGGRPRVRVALIARSGARIVLTQMPAGNTADGPRTTRVTEVTASRVGAGTIGTASIGGVFVTAKSALGADELRPLLQRLAPVR